MITQRLAYTSCVLAAAALALSFFLRGFIPGSAVMIAVGMLWLLGLRRRWGWVSGNMFLLFGVINAILLLIQAPPILEVISLSASLITWDLDHFQVRLDRIRSVEMARGVEKGHIAHLAAGVAAGILAAAAALLIHIQLSFAIALIAGAAALLFLSQAVSRLSNRRRRGEKPHQRASGIERN